MATIRLACGSIPFKATNEGPDQFMWYNSAVGSQHNDPNLAPHRIPKIA